MPDFPSGTAHGAWNKPVISSFEPSAPLGNTTLCGRQTGASAAWTGANVAIFIPFSLEEYVTVFRMGWYNGATIGTNNLDAGIFDGRGQTLLVSTGSTLSAGASAPQQVDTADVTLAPGDYYLALSCNGTTATVFRTANAVVTGVASGVRIATQFPLANNPTLGLPTASFYPLVFAMTRSAAI